MYILPVARSGFASLAPEWEIVMTQASLHLRKGTFSTLSQVKWKCERGAMAPLGKSESAELSSIEVDEPEAELFALAEEVDCAERTFHDALARRNEAQIAYLREPSITTRRALETAKAAEVVALEVLGDEIRRLGRIRATTITGLKLKASYASTVGKLADSIVEDILQL